MHPALDHLGGQVVQGATQGSPPENGGRFRRVCFRFYHNRYSEPLTITLTLGTPPRPDLLLGSRYNYKSPILGRTQIKRNGQHHRASNLVEPQLCPTQNLPKQPRKFKVSLLCKSSHPKFSIHTIWILFLFYITDMLRSLTVR